MCEGGEVVEFIGGELTLEETVGKWRLICARGRSQLRVSVVSFSCEVLA